MELQDKQLSQLNTIYKDYLKICDMLTYEEVVLDSKLCQKLEKDKAKISQLATKFEQYNQAVRDKEEFLSLLDTCSKEEHHLFLKEIDNLSNLISSISIELSNLLKAQDTTQDSIIVLIQHNNDYVSELLQKDILNGYLEFSREHNLQISFSENKNTTELKITGNSAYAYFKGEIGVHKAIKEGTISSCIVYVLHAPEEETISFDDNDINIQTCRSSGAGGQHINTTDSAIKATHIKSGISTICQSERSQFQNKVQAIEQLKEKVSEFYNKKHNDFISNQRTKQYKSLNLKDEIKTYNYDTKNISSKSNNSLSFDDFLKGKQL